MLFSFNLLICLTRKKKRLRNFYFLFVYIIYFDSFALLVFILLKVFLFFFFLDCILDCINYEDVCSSSSRSILLPRSIYLNLLLLAWLSGFWPSLMMRFGPPPPVVTSFRRSFFYRFFYRLGVD